MSTSASDYHKKVLVIQNEANEGLGLIKGELDKIVVEVEYVNIFDDKTSDEILQSRREDIDSYSHLIILGGTSSVYDEGKPFISDTLNLLEEAFKKDVSVLGLCLGAQLMAKALGARVYKGDRSEVGWHEVTMTIEASRDKCFSGFKKQETFFQWHGDTFDLPVNTTHLASSELFENQAFKFSSNSYALQFHPEVTSVMVRDWTQKIAKNSENRGFSEQDYDFKGREKEILLDLDRNIDFFSMFLAS